MKELYKILIVLMLPLAGFSQFGASLNYKVNNFRDFADVTFSSVDGNVSKIDLGSNVELGIHYWFRLKNKRIEFLPELTYAHGVKTKNFNDIALYVHTRIYPLDLANDCNCPTFSKQNTFFKKGFFISASPTIGMIQFPQSNRDLYYGGYLGVGLDFGISDLITLTPYARYGVLSKTTWQSINQYYEAGGADYDLTSGNRPLVVGISATFRFDEQNSF